MKILEATKVTNLDFDDWHNADQSPIPIVTVTDADGEEFSFAVQLVQGKHRMDFGCWIMDYKTAYVDDINPADYPTIDLSVVIEAAEKHAKKHTKIIESDYYFKYPNGRESIHFIGHKHDEKVALAAYNSQFLNSDTSPYQKQYDDLGFFDSQEKAEAWLKDNADADGNIKGGIELI